MKKLSILICAALCLLTMGCNKLTDKNAQKMNNWKEVLKSEMPLLGHRNWVVVTDMAYPLQSKEAITTLFADEPYTEVLQTVKEMLTQNPHVYPQVYQDRELSFMSDCICPGIDDVKKGIVTALSPLKVTSVPHEELIATLDSTSAVYKVIIIKTNLTKPYTSIFFRLDCKYWDADKQKMLDDIMTNTK
jgi:D-ribose pyranose/furanose isomerase RbsD